MRHLNTTAFSAGARDLRARTPHIPAFPPVMRGALMPAIRTIRRDLGLSTGDLLVLGALLSFLPCKDRETGAERPVGPDMVLVVFASNATLCDRANGMDERALRRHLSRLSDAGLIKRKQSATGKRFPLKRNGVIRDAFGIDLTPLLERHAELTDRAEQARRDAEELRSLRAEALALRAEALETAVPYDEEARSFLEQVKTILRRATLTVELVTGLISAITRMLSSGAPERQTDPCPVGPEPHKNAQPETRENQPVPVEPDISASGAAPTHQPAQPDKSPPETGPKSAEDGRIVRQQETYQINIKKRTWVNRVEKLWTRCQHVAFAYPKPPETETDLLRVIYEFGQLTRFDERILAEGVKSIGPEGLLYALDKIAEKGASIRCHYSYLTRIIQETGKHPYRTTLPV